MSGLDVVGGLLDEESSQFQLVLGNSFPCKIEMGERFTFYEDCFPLFVSKNMGVAFLRKAIKVSCDVQCDLK